MFSLPGHKTSKEFIVQDHFPLRPTCPSFCFEKTKAFRGEQSTSYLTILSMCHAAVTCGHREDNWIRKKEHSFYPVCQLPGILTFLEANMASKDILYTVLVSGWKH